MSEGYLDKEAAEALFQKGVAAGIFPENYTVSDSFGKPARNLKSARGRKRKRFDPYIMRNGLSKSEARGMRDYVEHLPLGVQYDTDENGKRFWKRKAGDRMSLDDIIKYIEYTPEFSQQYKDSGNFKDIITPGDFVDWAFTKSKSFNPETDAFNCPKGCHIERMEYVDRWQMLKVYFHNEGDIVIYTRVPYELFVKLKRLAETNAMGDGVDGKKHTLVGIAFWDYVRIRGTRHGNQYPALHLGKHGGQHGTGFSAEAQAKAVSRVSHRIGADGKAVSLTKMEEARKAAPQKALAFLDGELTARDIEKIRKYTTRTQGIEGTVANALKDGNIDEARKRGEFLLKYIETSPKVASLRKYLLSLPSDPSYEEPYAPLLDMETILSKQNLLPQYKED